MILYLRVFRTLKIPRPLGRLGFLFLFLLLPTVLAHCPLCTIGAAAAAGGALWLGVSPAVVSLFIGAFAIAMGWWISKLIKKKYFPGQDFVIIITSFLTTVLPILPLLKAVYPLPVLWFGEYGSLFNRTYVLNASIITSILGGGIVALSPWISARITAMRAGKMFRFQGIILTFLLLLIGSLVVEVIL